MGGASARMILHWAIIQVGFAPIVQHRYQEKKQEQSPRSMQATR